jgi:hypothetical protein
LRNWWTGWQGEPTSAGGRGNASGLGKARGQTKQPGFLKPTLGDLQFPDLSCISHKMGTYLCSFGCCLYVCRGKGRRVLRNRRQKSGRSACR